MNWLPNVARIFRQLGPRVTTIVGIDSLGWPAHGPQYIRLGRTAAGWQKCDPDTHYVPSLCNRVGYVEASPLTQEVAVGIEIARDRKPGTLEDDGQRTCTEKGCRQ